MFCSFRMTTTVIHSYSTENKTRLLPALTFCPLPGISYFAVYILCPYLEVSKFSKTFTHN
jgi:hypothetical protein